jgi:hypothetical protein
MARTLYWLQAGAAGRHDVASSRGRTSRVPEASTSTSSGTLARGSRLPSTGRPAGLESGEQPSTSSASRGRDPRPGGTGMYDRSAPAKEGAGRVACPAGPLRDRRRDLRRSGAGGDGEVEATGLPVPEVRPRASSRASDPRGAPVEPPAALSRRGDRLHARLAFPGTPSLTLQGEPPSKRDAVHQGCMNEYHEYAARRRLHEKRCSSTCAAAETHGPCNKVLWQRREQDPHGVRVGRARLPAPGCSSGRASRGSC